jgi:hypothetical protein
MNKDKKLNFLPALFWEVFKSERNKNNPNVDYENGEFLSLRASSDYVNNFFSKDQFVRMINKEIVRVNENKKIYKKDLELLKGIIIAIEVLKNKKLYVEKKDSLGRVLVHIYAPKIANSNDAVNTENSILGDRDFEMFFQFVDSKEFKSFQKSYLEAKKKATSQ